MPERETDPASLLCPGGNEHGRGGGRGSSWRKQTKRGIRPFNILHQSWISSWMDPNWRWQGQLQGSSGAWAVCSWGSFSLCVAGGGGRRWGTRCLEVGVTKSFCYIFFLMFKNFEPWVLVICWCEWMNEPWNSAGENNKHLSPHPISERQESGISLAEWFWLMKL